MQRNCRIAQLLAGLIAVAGMVSISHAVEPGQYGPADRSGHGLFINCNGSDQCVVFWFNHLSEDEQVWLMGVPLCERGPDQVCDVSLTRPSAPRWNGVPGEVDLGEFVGTLEITPLASGDIAVDWDVRALRWNVCDTGIGGLILRKCIGAEQWTRIAGPAPPDG